MTLDEQIDKILQALVDFATQRFDDELGIAYSAPVAKLAIKALIADEVKKATKATGETSDGYHTFNELYDYRRVYNAALFNEWYQQGGRHSVHKSWRHSDGELCFGGGWFVVVAELPTGQITNHYQAEFWDDFQIPEQKTANTYDGHTPKEALNRLAELQSTQPSNKAEDK